MKKVEWTMTDAARAALTDWNRRWQELILSTKPIDVEKASDAVKGMYAAAKLDEPLVVRCLSPIQGAIVWAWASAYWSVMTKAKAATHAATDAATHAATYAATRAATYAATDAATDAATRAATHAATRRSSDQSICMWNAARDVVLSKLGQHLFQRAAKIAETNVRSWYDAYNGGNEWASWCAFLSFPRDICGWNSPTHANYAHYENASIHGGGRFMHPKFCLLCDRPLVRKTRIVGTTHQLHCEDGPSIEWRCGTRTWHLSGVPATEKAVMRPHELTPSDIHSVQDEELRSAMLERYPWPRYLGDVGAKCIDEGANEIEGTYEALFDAQSVGQRRMVATCATGHIVSLGVPQSVNTLMEARRYLSPFGNKTRIVART